MRPSVCMLGEEVDIDWGKPLDDVIPSLLCSMEEPSERMESITRLWKLTGVVENRVAVVCTTKWDVLDKVIACIEGEGECVRTACLVLNNLSVPIENKAVMALGQWGDRLLAALVSIMRRDLPETYLCCTCLANLTFLPDAVGIAINFVPPVAANNMSPEEPEFRNRNDSLPRNRSLNKSMLLPLADAVPTVLQDQQSLLRVLECTLHRNAPFLLAPVTSTQGEALRRSCHLVRNLAAHSDGPKLLALTAIPRLLISFLQNTNKPVVRWTSQSLEDSALATLCHLACNPCAKDALSPIEGILEPIIAEGGIHAYRASAIASALHS